MIVDHFAIRLAQLIKEYKQVSTASVPTMPLGFDGFANWVLDQTKPAINGVKNGQSGNGSTPENSVPEKS